MLLGGIPAAAVIRPHVPDLLDLASQQETDLPHGVQDGKGVSLRRSAGIQRHGELPAVGPCCL